jgi:hypothetical protein
MISEIGPGWTAAAAAAGRIYPRLQRNRKRATLPRKETVLSSTERNRAILLATGVFELRSSPDHLHTLCIRCPEKLSPADLPERKVDRRRRDRFLRE